VFVSALDLLAFVALAVGLTPHFGHVGVSMAVAGSAAVQAALLFLALLRTRAAPNVAELAFSAAKVTVASAVAAALPRVLVREASPIVTVSVSVASFAVVFPACALALRSPEVSSLASTVMRRVRRRASRGA